MLRPLKWRCVLPVFLTLALGLIQATQLGIVTQALARAARDGCRVAASPGTTQADVQERVAQLLSGSGLPVPTVSPSPANWTTAPRGTPITVTLNVHFSKVSWLNDPFGLGFSNLTPEASVTMPSAQSLTPEEFLR